MKTETIKADCRKNRYTPMWTMTQREISRIFRVWTQTIIPPMITSVLFILIFGYSLGSRIDEVAGVSYLEFIVPGLLMMGVITSAYANTSFSLFISRWHNMTQEWLSAPISYWHMIFALTIGGVARGVIVGLGILLISLSFTSLVVSHVFILLYFIIMVSLLFSFAGIITALWATNFDRLNVFSVFLITPLTYLGGVFYSITMLPPFWATIAKLNPVFYMVDGFRYGFIGTSDVSVLFSMALVFVFSLIAFLWCVYWFRIGYNIRS